jgi:hypothetical protein
MLTIPCSILSRLQKICANNNRNYESAPSDEINRRSLTEDEFGRTYIISASEALPRRKCILCFNTAYISVTSTITKMHSSRERTSHESVVVNDILPLFTTSCVGNTYYG